MGTVAVLWDGDGIHPPGVDRQTPVKTVPSRRTTYVNSNNSREAMQTRCRIPVDIIVFAFLRFWVRIRTCFLNGIKNGNFDGTCKPALMKQTVNAEIRAKKKIYLMKQGYFSAASSGWM